MRKRKHRPARFSLPIAMSLCGMGTPRRPCGAAASREGRLPGSRADVQQELRVRMPKLHLNGAVSALRPGAHQNNAPTDSARSSPPASAKPHCPP